jgi:hypothetical protein
VYRVVQLGLGQIAFASAQAESKVNMPELIGRHEAVEFSLASVITTYNMVPKDESSLLSSFFSSSFTFVFLQHKIKSSVFYCFITLNKCRNSPILAAFYKIINI